MDIKWVRPFTFLNPLFKPPPPPPLPYCFHFHSKPFHFFSITSKALPLPSSPLLFFSSPTMVKMSRGHSFRPRVHRSSPPPAGGSNLGSAVVAAAPPPTTASVVVVVHPPAIAAVALATAQGGPVVGSAETAAVSHASVVAAPALRKYHTRVGPIPPSPPHPRPSWRAPPSKRARIYGPGESSSSRSQNPQSPTNQSPAGALLLDLSPASLIRRPYFHCSPILGNIFCSVRDLHDEVIYDLPALAEDPEL